MAGRNRIDPPPSLPAAIGVIPLASIAAAPATRTLLRFAQDSPHFERDHEQGITHCLESKFRVSVRPHNDKPKFF